MNHFPKRFVGPLAVALSATLCHAADPADLVLTGGNIITMEPAQPVAQAIACRGDRILAVGDFDEIAAHVGPDTQVIGLDGLTVIPGFIEGHGHFIQLGFSKLNLDLTQAGRWEEIVELVRAATETTPPGEWIIGRGWHQSKWDPPPEPNVEGYPVHAELSRAAPDNPVRLVHASGHMSIVNELALEMAGITTNTPDPDGGEILRDAKGHPTGVLRETAQSLLSSGRQSRNAQSSQRLRAIDLATEECLRNGITSFQDAWSSFADVDLFRELAESGQLGIRLWVMIGESNARLRRHLADYRMVGVGQNHLTVRGIKRSIDGALGTHGAWLLEPYNDLPDSSGLQTLSTRSLRETAELALEHDFQLCVHAIGDRANREVLNLFEEAFQVRSGSGSRRWRIEHAQHLHPDDIPRFAGLGVIASMQGVHCTSDAVFVVDRLGEQRARDGAYVWQSLLQSGAIVTNGTDTPVEDVNPIRSFHASVTRRLDGGSSFYPEQRMTRAQALRSYTLDAAHAAFEEELKGSLTPGKLADMVVLSHDLLNCSDEDVLDTQCHPHDRGRARVVFQGTERNMPATERLPHSRPFSPRGEGGRRPDEGGGSMDDRNGCTPSPSPSPLGERGQQIASSAVILILTFALLRREICT